MITGWDFLYSFDNLDTNVPIAASNATLHLHGNLDVEDAMDRPPITPFVIGRAGPNVLLNYVSDHHLDGNGFTFELTCVDPEMGGGPGGPPGGPPGGGPPGGGPDEPTFLDDDSQIPVYMYGVELADLGTAGTPVSAFVTSRPGAVQDHSAAISGKTVYLFGGACTCNLRLPVSVFSDCLWLTCTGSTETGLSNDLFRVDM